VGNGETTADTNGELDAPYLSPKLNFLGRNTVSIAGLGYFQALNPTNL
jgi:hypothetical protein